ncbi:hypothetical protein BT96DRAFT_271409 [Gymnopus androsaceus JB14]|uniref:Uncharacterized protein n=1 Tax=Gymnopus androsaceus JB14 TaxID=1447944 RepID=A0A6A4H4A5_9AGAR|nr:hypothetical protein BT96DRAFT_271409 [Gymnopus androsaceus JB14]
MYSNVPVGNLWTTWQAGQSIRTFLRCTDFCYFPMCRACALVFFTFFSLVMVEYHYSKSLILRPYSGLLELARYH